MILGEDLWDIIAINITLYILYNNFKTTTTRLLEIRDKTIDQIQRILELRKAKNDSKQTTEVVGDLAILLRNNNNNYQNET